MSNEPKEPFKPPHMGSDPREDVAQYLASAFSGVHVNKDDLTHEELESLTPMQRLLCHETQSMCLGLYHKNLQTGQSRIRENLLTVIALMGDEPSQEQAEIIKKLGNLIGAAAFHGLSMDSVQFKNPNFQEKIR